MTKKKTPKTWTIEFEITGRGYLTVEAEDEEAALDAGWKAYHEGEQLEGVEWEVEDANASEDK